MIVFYIVFGTLAVVDLYLFGEAVGDKGFTYNRIAFVFFIGKN